MARDATAVKRRSAGIIGQEDMVLMTKMRGEERDIAQEETKRKMTEQMRNTDQEDTRMVMREASSIVHEDTGTTKVLGTIAEGQTAILHLAMSTTVDGTIANTDGVNLWTRSHVAANCTTTNVVGLREIVPVVIETQTPHACTTLMGIVCKAFAFVNFSVVCL
jgi:hypothetical protein